MGILVTGGGGFLGSAIVKQLTQRNEIVRSLSRALYPQLETWGVQQIQGDLADYGKVQEAVSGCKLVFHIAAKAGVWGSFHSFYHANVVGTQNILKACREQGVTKLVYASSPSVVFAGTDQEGIDETAPYPSRHLAFYPQTKAEAEQLVNRAADASLATVSLRPHLIWGPGDNHLIPRIIEQGRQGKLRLIDGSQKLVDSVFIDNAADAFLQAATLLQPNAPISGKNYFITNDEPIPMAELINGILDAATLPRVTRSVPSSAAYAAAATFEFLHKVLRLKSEPRLTKFVVRQLATAHWFDISASKRDLSYHPKITIRQGLELLKKALQAPNNLKKPHHL